MSLKVTSSNFGITTNVFGTNGVVSTSPCGRWFLDVPVFFFITNYLLFVPTICTNNNGVWDLDSGRKWCCLKLRKFRSGRFVYRHREFGVENEIGDQTVQHYLLVNAMAVKWGHHNIIYRMPSSMQWISIEDWQEFRILASFSTTNSLWISNIEPYLSIFNNQWQFNWIERCSKANKDIHALWW